MQQWQTFLYTFLNMSLRYAAFIDEVFFLLKAKFLVLGYSAQALDYQDFQITGH